MLVLTHASLATVDELFRYKSQGFQLEDFPGYTPDQWGIKAHNRSWIEEAGEFAGGQRCDLTHCASLPGQNSFRNVGISREGGISTGDS